MKYLDSPRSEADIAEYEAEYPSDFNGVYAQGGYGAFETDGESSSIRQFLQTLLNHWILIISMTLAATAGTIVYVAQNRDYYRSTARVQVNAENSVLPPTRNGGANPIIISSQSNDPAYFSTQLQVLEGSSLLQRVVKTLDLEHNPTFQNPSHGKSYTVWQNVERMLGLYKEPPSGVAGTKPPTVEKAALPLRPVDEDDDAETDKYAPFVGSIKKSLSVMPVKDNRTFNRETRLIEISFTHGDPELAAKIANTIADVYVLQNLEQKIQSRASAGDFLQRRVAELQSSIRLGEERLNNYARENQIVSLDASQNTVVQRFSSLNQALGAAENDRIAAQTAYEAALQNQMRAATAEGSDPQVNGLEARLSDLRQRLAQLKTEYTDEWWEVVQTRKQIETVENQLASFRKRASDVQLAGLKQRLDEATNRENRLRTAFNQQRDDVMRQNEASVNYRIIEQEINTNKQLLDSLLQRSRENDIILNDTPNNVFVAERAVVPQVPAGPDRSKSVLMAFALSFLAGCGLAFLLDWLDDSVQHSDEIESVLGLPLLAAVPAAPTTLAGRLLPRRLTNGRSKVERVDRYDLEAFGKFEFSEAYTQLRTHLMLSRAGGPPKTILIASGEEQEGKSVTAVNFALNLCATGKKVLLIDADLRYPRINVIRSLDNRHGLTTLLASGEINDEQVGQAIQRDPNAELDVITAGQHSVNPANLLSSEQMRLLLKNLSERYTHIIIDSPPALFFADSTILSTLVDSVIIVVRDGRSSRQSVLKAQRLFQSVGAKVAGMVINAVPRQRNKYSKYHYYEHNTKPADEKDLQPLKLH